MTVVDAPQVIASMLVVVTVKVGLKVLPQASALTAYMLVADPADVITLLVVTTVLALR